MNRIVHGWINVADIMRQQINAERCDLCNYILKHNKCPKCFYVPEKYRPEKN